MTDAQQETSGNDDRGWSPALFIDDFARAARRSDWNGSIPVDANWRAVLRAEAPGSIACTADGALHLAWPTSASLVHLFTFVQLPDVAPGNALQVRVVLTSGTVADLLRVLVAVVLQHRQGDAFFNSLSVRDLRIVRSGQDMQAIAEGVLDELPAGMEPLKLLFRLNPAAGELAVRSVEVLTRAVPADHPPFPDQDVAPARDPDVLAAATFAAPAAAAPVAVQDGLPRLIQPLPAGSGRADAPQVLEALAGLRSDVARLAATIGTRLPGTSAEAEMERLTAELAALVRYSEETRQALVEQVEELAAENTRLRRELDHARQAR